MHLRTTSPPTRANDDLELSPHQWEILLRHQQKFTLRNHRDPDITAVAQDECTAFRAPYLTGSLVYVITETMMQYPWVYVTEKTWKAMLAPVPFMMLAAPGTLAWLRSQGFQTFDQWWNEDYDILPRAADRVEAVVQQLVSLSKLNPAQLTQIRLEMAPVLQHNLANIGNLRQRELAKIQTML